MITNSDRNTDTDLEQQLDSLFDTVTPYRMEQHPEEIRSFAGYLISDVRPVHVLEIGVRHGGTAALWTQVCGLQQGQVIGIDWYGADSLGKLGTNDIAESMEQRYNNYHFICGDSHDRSTKDKLLYFMGVLGIGSFDLIFIDGDHSYDGVKEDFETYRDLLSVGRGVIAFHDIVETDLVKQFGHGVWKFWRELATITDQGNVVREFSIASDWGGIGCLGCGLRDA